MGPKLKDVQAQTYGFAKPNFLDRCAGALLGLACGDALGTAVEFRPRGSFNTIVDMVGGGPFSLAPRQWTRGGE